MEGEEKQRLYARARILAIITVAYNLVEGVVSVAFGISDETFTLFGFGLDSFVEVVSGVGIWHMTRRIAADSSAAPDPFERNALRITGAAFYLLATGLALTAVATAVQGHQPETTVWGAVVGGISIATMWLLIRLKVGVGKALASDAILADAACTRACLYLSVILLCASIAYELTGFGYIDSVGTLLIAWFAFSEGREALGKAAGKPCACSCCG